jgi:hypothetical protein
MWTGCTKSSQSGISVDLGSCPEGGSVDHVRLTVTDANGTTDHADYTPGGDGSGSLTATFPASVPGPVNVVIDIYAPGNPNPVATYHQDGVELSAGSFAAVNPCQNLDGGSDGPTGPDGPPADGSGGVDHADGGGGSDLSPGDAGDLGPGPDVGPDMPRTGPVTVYVNGVSGDDSNDGSSINPFKTITRGLREVQSSSNPTIYLAGGDTTNVVHYAVNETFPFDLPPYTQLIGDSADTLSIDGAGDCGNGITCTFNVNGAGVLIQGIQVQNPAGIGILIGTGAQSLLLQNSTVASSATGARIQGGSQHQLTNALFDQNTTGLIVEGDAQVTLGQVTVQGSDAAGVVVRGTATLTSTGGEFNGNNGLALDLREGSTVTLNGGDIAGNGGNGLALSGCSGPSTRVTLMGVMVHKNEEGLAIECGQAVLQDTAMYLNRQSGIHVSGSGTADLGGGFASSEGRNTPNHTQTDYRNTNAGVCNQTSTAISALNCMWPDTSPSNSSTCVGMVDTSGPVTTQ